jgi:hypothetical protein
MKFRINILLPSSGEKSKQNVAKVLRIEIREMKE